MIKWVKHRLKIKLRNNIINKKIDITTLDYNLRNTLKILVINLFKKTQQKHKFQIKLWIVKMKLNHKMLNSNIIHKLINNLIYMKINKNNKQNQSKKLKHKLIINISKLLLKINKKFNFNKM